MFLGREFTSRWMAFIDGTNFLCHLSEELNIKFRADKPPPESIIAANALITHLCNRKLGYGKIRRYWFASYKGNEEYHRLLIQELRKNDFEPVLFKKREEREKGVDLALAKEMLVNSFNQNFDIGILIAGDEDYVGLVKEVKRYGPIIRGAFFNHGLSDKLKMVFDDYYDIIKDNREALGSSAYQNALIELKS